MPYSKKKSRKPNLVHDFPISNMSFMYITNRRRSTKEPLYVTLDRILEEHKRLATTKKKEEGADYNLLDNR